MINLLNDFMKEYILSKLLNLIKSWRKPYFDFSQLGEEKVLLNIIERIASQRKINHHYIDIGGYNPIIFSNTYKLYQKNWCGLIVEPNKNKLKDWNKVRPKDYLVNCALVEKNYNEEKIKIYFNRENSADETAHPKTKVSELNYYEAKTIKLKKIFDICEKKFSKPFFLNMDIEGNEDKLLLELNNIDYKVPLICVELFLDKNINQFSVFDYKKLDSVIFLEKIGYYLVSICGPSLIFCDKNHWVPFSKL
tara:strand:- start:2962 stop:3711 length:750 start_codon:yes stop_codon:yes gene_type:complete